MKVTLLIPTLNEIQGMKEIMPRIKKEWVDQIIIIDGDSTDGTLEYAKENNWTNFILHTSHLCMLTKPKELAVILFGMQIFL